MKAPGWAPAKVSAMALGRAIERSAVKAPATVLETVPAKEPG